MKKIARNDLCWCGSGKKYKKCHLDSDIAGGTVTKERIAAPPGVIIKTASQIEGIRKSSRLTRDVLAMVSERMRPGIATDTINEWVHEYIVSRGAVPAPLNYNGYPKSVCVSLNNVICHGIPDATVIREGDILNVDVTTILDGYYGDAGKMFMIGDVSAEARRLVQVARECLDVGIDQVMPYRDFGEIGYAIEQHAVKNGFSVVRDYGGHGIGIRFHEEPHVHHYGSRKRGIMMMPGMVFTIEPMINQGRFETRLMPDSWTAVTIDGKLSAQWEHTILVTETGAEIMTE